MFWVEVLVAAVASWGAGLSTYIWLQDKQLREPWIDIHRLEKGTQSVELKIANRASERIVIAGVKTTCLNKSNLETVHSINESAVQMMKRLCNSRCVIHLPVEPGKTRKMTLSFAPDSLEKIDLKFVWYYDRPAHRRRRCLRFTRAGEEMKQSIEARKSNFHAAL